MQSVFASFFWHLFPDPHISVYWTNIIEPIWACHRLSSHHDTSIFLHTYRVDPSTKLNRAPLRMIQSTRYVWGYQPPFGRLLEIRESFYWVFQTHDLNKSGLSISEKKCFTCIFVIYDKNSAEGVNRTRDQKNLGGREGWHPHDLPEGKKRISEKRLAVVTVLAED